MSTELMGEPGEGIWITTYYGGVGTGQLWRIGKEMKSVLLTLDEMQALKEWFDLEDFMSMI